MTEIYLVVNTDSNGESCDDCVQGAYTYAAVAEGFAAQHSGHVVISIELQERRVVFCSFCGNDEFTKKIVIHRHGAAICADCISEVKD